MAAFLLSAVGGTGWEAGLGRIEAVSVSYFFSCNFPENVQKGLVCPSYFSVRWMEIR